MQQYIGFHLNDSEYTLPILRVREIITAPAITKMPQSLPYVEGITNLRGSIVPIVNLKKLVGLDNGDSMGDKVIVVAAGNICFGIVVDGITGVISIDESVIEPPEKFLASAADQVEGVAKLRDRLVVLLDTKKLIPCGDAGMFEDLVVDVQESGDSRTVEVVKQVQTMGGEMKVKEIVASEDFFGKMNIRRGDPRYQIMEELLAFMEAVANGDHEEMDAVMKNIMKKGQSDLFQEIGKVTRKLHDSIRTFKDALDPKIREIAHVDMPSAVDSLEFVIGRTEEAANRTMEIVEKHILGMDEFSSHLRKISEPAESAAYLRNFRNRLEDDLTELITTQSFQDITGQAIRKVIGVVNDVEGELVRLISTFGLKEEEAEQVEKRVKEIISQSGVDELLKEFGF